ncbi:MAG: ABC transporter substrate-binding protein, partial [Burkholderiales bacterium]
AQAVINWSSSRAPIILTNAYRQVGLTLPLVHGHAALSPAVLKGTGANGEGMLAAGPKFEAAAELPDSDPQKGVTMKFREAYRNKYGKEPNQFGGGAYDAFQILRSSLQKAGTDPAQLCAAIQATRGHVGIGGVYNYSASDHSGLGKDAVVMYRAQGGRWNLLR